MQSLIWERVFKDAKNAKRFLEVRNNKRTFAATEEEITDIGVVHGSIGILINKKSKTENASFANGGPHIPKG